MHKPDSQEAEENREISLLQAILQLDHGQAWPTLAAISEQRLCEGENLCEQTPSEATTQAFWQTLDQCWSSQTTQSRSRSSSQGQEGSAAVSRHLQALPVDLVNRLLEQAQALSQRSVLQLDKLVIMAQAIFPDWSTDDLKVLARPYAYAMRGYVEDTQPPVAWENLGELEQIRLSLAAAKAILEQDS